MKCLLYRPSWQALRVSFLAENRTDGGWTTALGTKRNLEILDKYVKGENTFKSTFLLEASFMGFSEATERSLRLYRAINCLNAVRMGNSGQGTKGSEHDLMVLAARDKYQSMQSANYRQHLDLATRMWDWRQVKREVEQLFTTRGSFDQVEHNLLKRVKFSEKKTSATSTQKNRSELVTFVEIMRLVRTGE